MKSTPRCWCTKVRASPPGGQPKQCQTPSSESDAQRQDVLVRVEGTEGLGGAPSPGDVGDLTDQLYKVGRFPDPRRRTRNHHQPPLRSRLYRSGALHSATPPRGEGQKPAARVVDWAVDCPREGVDWGVERPGEGRKAREGSRLGSRKPARGGRMGGRKAPEGVDWGVEPL